MGESVPAFRYRISYAKLDSLKYTGHLDMHRIWERSLRRAGLPLAYSLGFHPQPRIQQACPLPLGFTSRCELVDVWLKQEIDANEILHALNQAVPPGMRVDTVQSIGASLPSLQSVVVSVEYSISLTPEAKNTDLQQSVEQLLAAHALPRERRGRAYDLRPLVEELSISAGGSDLQIRLAAREGATGRPEEVLEVLGISPVLVRIERARLILQTG